jgi:hypothetical protein
MSPPSHLRLDLLDSVTETKELGTLSFNCFLFSGFRIWCIHGSENNRYCIVMLLSCHGESMELVCGGMTSSNRSDGFGRWVVGETRKS